jgi:hypothetical protein
MLRSLAPLIALLALACAGDVDSRLKPLTVATLQPGVGLGDARLGQTTLGAFVERYGHDRVDLIAGDSIGYELVFSGGEMAFLFVLDPQIRSIGLDTLQSGRRDLIEAIGAHPELRDMRLSSLTVGARTGSTDSAYAGKLATGSVGLFGKMADAVVELGVPSEGTIPLLAGASPRSPETELFYPERGVVLEGRGKLVEPDCVITRMTIFEPQEP